MKRIETHQMGIDQGNVLLFSDFQEGGDMWSGTGEREVRHAIVFDEPFLDAPAVHVNLSMLDMDEATNHRTDIRADQVTREGFTIVFTTWADTRIARARATWTAMGAVRHKDDWNLSS